MTEEEQKAIEVLKNVDINLSGNIICSECVKPDNKTCCEDNGEDCQVHSIKILLNLIQKQQKEKKLLEDQKQYIIDEYGNTIEKKDKIIDEMAKDKYNNVDMYEMADMAKEIGYSIQKLFSGLEDKEIYEIIKQYFEKKIEDKQC